LDANPQAIVDAAINSVSNAAREKGIVIEKEVQNNLEGVMADAINNVGLK
jgi:hypothetical protein